MATARYTVVTTGGVEAYGGLGLGGVRVTFDNENAGYSKSETVGGGQVMIGARYAVTPRSKVFVEARKLDTFEDAAVAEQNGPATAEYDATHVLFGFRQSF
jgi:opacity protein-like surface antigen